MVKQLRSDRVTPIQAARFRAEYILGRELADVDGLLTAERLIAEPDCCAIVYPHFPGETPRSATVVGQDGWGRFLGFAIQLTRVLGRLHRRRVIHRDIKPGNLLFNPATEELRVIDFGIATRLSSDLQAPVQPEELEGTLEYMAPEQTGRMNRQTDYRADYYALGVTLYEILTGQLPFMSADPLEIIHSHLARVPQSPAEICPSIPGPLCRIVLRLLEKMPEARYQSSGGILEDLEACAAAWASEGEIPESLPLSRGGGSEILAIPTRLYGREKEASLLARAFAHASQGVPSLLLLSGPAGIGKSALVHELDRSVFVNHGWFLSGKFEQLRQDRPFGALSEAFDGLVREILALPENALKGWREEFGAALGQMGAVLTPLVPGLEALLGPQPAVPELPPGQTLERQNELLLRSIAALPKASRPVVLFLDDWQWADSASQNWLETMVAAEIPHLLLIVAWRDDEVPAAHPFASRVTKLLQIKADAHVLQLSPLSPRHAAEFLQDTLRSADPALGELARIFVGKTHGNPFYIRQLLQALDLAGAIQWEPGKGGWRIDPATVERMVLTENVVDLLVTRLRQFPEEVSLPLRVAAAIGTEFDLALLSKTCGQAHPELLRNLALLRAENYVLPHDRFTKELLAASEALDAGADVDLGVARFRFSHDRIQQAAYELVPEEERPRIHLSLARHLASRPEQPGQGGLFEVAGHYAQATALVEEAGERSLAQRILIRAAKAARTAGSPDVALRYLDAAKNLPSIGGRDAVQRFAAELLRERGIASALLGRQSEADAAFQELLGSGGDRETKADVHHWQISLALSRGDFRSAVTAALEGIQLFCPPIPRKPGLLRVVWAMLKVKRRLRGLDPERLLDLPRMTDPGGLWMLRLLTRGNTGFLFEDSMLYALVNIRLFEATLRHGLAPESAGSIAAWAILLCTAMNDPVSAAQFVRVSIQHAEASGDPEQRCLCYMTQGGIIGHWRNPLAESRPWIEKAIQASMECGLVEYTGYCHSHLCFHSAFEGRPPGECIRQAETLRAHAAKHRLEDVVLNMLALRQFSKALLGETESPTSLSDESIRHNDVAQQARHFRAKIPVQFLNLCEGRLLLYDGRPEEAFRILHGNVAYDAECVGMTQIPDNAFYLGLAAAGVAARDPRRAGFMRRVLHRQVRRFERWTGWCEPNFLARHLLLQGALLELRGKPFEAVRFYERSNESARRQGHWHIAALAAERSARLALLHGHPQSSTAALREMHSALSHWGASALLDRLEREFPFLALEKDPYLSEGPFPALGRVGTRGGAASTSAASHQLDLGSLIKSTQALSGEIEQARLVDRMLQIVLENAGATRGVLLLADAEGLLRFEAESIGAGATHPLGSVALDAANGPAVSRAAITLAVRQRVPLILHNTRDCRELAGDDYLRSKPPGALLVLPLLQRVKLLGALYLENSLTTHAFTPSRVGFLTSLASQIAISLENARLYAGLSELNHAYERFVPKQFLSLLGKRRITQVRAGDSTEREMTVLFSDIRGFTALSEALSPAQTFDFINKYLRCVTGPIRDRGGFVDKYIGDGIMALFADAPDRALHAAVEMLHALRDYNYDRAAAAPGTPPIRIGIGINTGELMLGTLGNEERMDGTVISDAVNLASRLESLNKGYETTVLISEHTRQRLERPADFYIRRIDRVRVRGKVQPVTIYEVFDADPPHVLRLKAETVEAFEQGIDAYQRHEISLARSLFEEIVAHNPEDCCARMYADRCGREAV